MYSNVRILNLVLHPHLLQGKFDNALLRYGGPDQLQTTLSEANRNQPTAAYLYGSWQNNEIELTTDELSYPDK